MHKQELATRIEDHALERVPLEDRKNWLAISWNTVGLVTSIAILFFGALVCFVAGVRIALLAGLSSFAIGTAIGWAIARVAYSSGCSNTLITRQYGLGIRGSALASLIFGALIIGFLAIENALLYRGFLFFFGIADSWQSRIAIYGSLTAAWILLTAFGFDLVARFSSLMIISFLVVMAYMLSVIIGQSGKPLADVLLFGSQFPPEVLAGMGVRSDFDKYIFALNVLLGPACAIALNTADFGRYGKSVGDVGAAATLGVFFQSLLIALIGGVLVFAASPVMLQHYEIAEGMGLAQAQHEILKNPGSIAATFIVFGGFIGFLLMLVAQAKAQVLNTYSSSLCIANLADALLNWRPGRLYFVVIANIIALLMLYGQLLELVEAWIRLMGVLLSSLSGVIIADYYLVKPVLEKRTGRPADIETVNWAGVVTIVVAVLAAHYLLRTLQPVEVLSSLAITLLLYPLLKLARPVRA